MSEKQHRRCVYLKHFPTGVVFVVLTVHHITNDTQPYMEPWPVQLPPKIHNTYININKDIHTIHLYRNGTHFCRNTHQNAENEVFDVQNFHFAQKWRSQPFQMLNPKLRPWNRTHPRRVCLVYSRQWWSTGVWLGLPFSGLWLDSNSGNGDLTRTLLWWLKLNSWWLDYNTGSSQTLSYKIRNYFIYIHVYRHMGNAGYLNWIWGVEYLPCEHSRGFKLLGLKTSVLWELHTD